MILRPVQESLAAQEPGVPVADRRLRAERAVGLPRYDLAEKHLSQFGPIHVALNYPLGVGKAGSVELVPPEREHVHRIQQVPQIEVAVSTKPEPQRVTVVDLPIRYGVQRVGL